MSGGQKQRVAIARSLINNPDIIFADEPTGNLDSKSGKEIMHIFKKLNDKGTTIILVTHDEFTASFASRIIKLGDGIIESRNDGMLQSVIFIGYFVRPAYRRGRASSSVSTGFESLDLIPTKTVSIIILEVFRKSV